MAIPYQPRISAPRQSRLASGAEIMRSDPLPKYRSRSNLGLVTPHYPPLRITWQSSEARDSGLCAASTEIQKRFTNDIDNLTLAAPTLNRYDKVAKDAAEWQPKHNLCWFAGRVLAIKLEYGLTVDPQEAVALEAMLEGCRIEHVLRPYRPEPSP